MQASKLITVPMGSLLVLAAVLAVYLPALHAGFVWDDLVVFQQRGWLYEGDQWKTYVFQGFNNWQHYFRPLVVALFVLQARLFDGAAAPMHAVSLLMQLTNVALIVVLARRVSFSLGVRGQFAPLLAGLAFGLHPMLVETVVWVGCQFDQMQVMFALSGLLASLMIHSVWPRALVVAGLFFLSACSKESAAAYPAIVMVFDWLLRSDANLTLMPRIHRVIQDNWRTYLLLMLAGSLYLLLRWIAMGELAGGVPPSDYIPSWERLDEIAYVYLKYWMVIPGIPFELNPLHPVEAVRFGENAGLAAVRLSTAAAITCLSVALLATQQFRVTGAMVVGASLYLFPVLGFFPGHFDGSLYHERYAIGAVALCASLLPAAIDEWRSLVRNLKAVRIMGAIVVAAWLGWAVISVRVTIPLWSNDLALWQWAANANPDNSLAKGNLISALVSSGRLSDAYSNVQDALDRNLNCDYCYLNGLDLAVNLGDVRMADATRIRVRDSENIMHDLTLAQSYWRAVGQLELRLGNTADAVQLLQESIRLEPSESGTHLILAEALIRLGEIAQAEGAVQRAVELAYPGSRDQTQHMGTRILAGEQVFGMPIPASHFPQIRPNMLLKPPPSQ